MNISENSLQKYYITFYQCILQNNNNCVKNMKQEQHVEFEQSIFYT